MGKKPYNLTPPPPAPKNAPQATPPPNAAPPKDRDKGQELPWPPATPPDHKPMKV